MDMRILESLRRQQLVTEYIIYPFSDIENYQIQLTNVPSSSKEDVLVVSNKKILSHWVESTGNVWTKIPRLVRNTPLKIYTLTGNPSAVSASNGENTFLFFDDFNGTVINTNKWVEVDNISNYVTQNNQLLFGTGGGWGVAGVYSVKNFERPIVFETYIYSTNTATDFMFAIKDATTGLSYTDYIHGVHLYNSQNIEIYQDGSGTGLLTTYTINTDMWIRVELFATGGKFYKSTDRKTWTLFYTSVYSTETPIKIGYSPNNVGNTRVDEVIVRNYTTPTPIIKKIRTLNKSLLLKELMG